MFFKIDFEVDNGASYEKDSAIVDAGSFDEAKEALRKYINSIDSETCISQIFNITVFTGSVFTGRHGHNQK